MSNALDSLAGRFAELEQELGKLRLAPALMPAGQRWRSDAQALLFHLRRQPGPLPLVAVLGGTGTGKSTLVNRLLGTEASATSFRRTFTSGAVAIARQAAEIPEGWLGLPREVAEALPVRGEAGKLLIVALDVDLTKTITLLDTPDLDGDQPLHHAEADRVFRWAEAVVFLVTPEKYQMTELLPYYRLARRYALPALFVMNKCEETAVLEDFRRQLAGRDWPEARLFVIPRDDAGYEPPADWGLEALHQAMGRLGETIWNPGAQPLRQQALQVRGGDLLGRLRDQVLAPLRSQRGQIEQLLAALGTLTAPEPGVDVSPVTRQLQRHLQEQSVLYLIGPQRILDRVRQVPGLLMRLPRSAWDFLAGTPSAGAGAAAAPAVGQVPDFPALLTDQFRILQSRIDDLLAASPAAGSWLELSGPAYQAVKIPPGQAGTIAEEELAELKRWLEERWQKTPRDTATLQKFLRLLPGGKQLTRYSEAAPYLLTIILATHGALFGHIDLLILGSYTLAAWLGERLSNEVTARTRQSNRRIGERFARLAQEQIERVGSFLQQQAPSPAELHRLERLAEEAGG